MLEHLETAFNFAAEKDRKAVAGLRTASRLQARSHYFPVMSK